jgi:hypothetical protein
MVLTYVPWAGLQLLVSRDPLTSASRVAETIDAQYYSIRPCRGLQVVDDSESSMHETCV